MNKMRRTSNGGIPAVATVQAARTAGVTTLSVDTQQYWPTIGDVAFSTYKLDTQNNRVAGSQVDWTGTSNGTNTISGLTRTGGAADTGNAIGDKVQMGPTAQWAEDLIEGLGSQHSLTDGSHGAITATTVAATGAITAASFTPTGAVLLDGTSNSSYRYVLTSADGSNGYFTKSFAHGLTYIPWINAQVVDALGAVHPMPWIHTLGADHWGSGSAIKPPELWIEIESIDATNINVVGTFSAISGLSIFASNESAPGFQFKFWCYPQP
jgi:hypothetical protein